MNPAVGNPVSINIKANSHFNNLPKFYEGDIIYINKNSISPQRVKNKQSIHRLFKSEYKPHAKIEHVNKGYGNITIRCGSFYF